MQPRDRAPSPNAFSAGIDLMRQNLTSKDVRYKDAPALKELPH